jgi:flagellar hook-length control protein FliK
MINFFQMIPAANLGVQISGGTLADGNAVDSNNSLFAAILQKINGSSGNAGTSDGLALLLNSAVADTATVEGSIDTNGITVNNIERKTSKSLIQPQDLTLPAEATSQLISFLKTKGFSTDQIDKMVIASTDNEGMVKLDKLVSAMNLTVKGSGLGNNLHQTSTTAINAHQTSATGMVIDSSSIPKVQEMLFKMGLGVGEVKSAIEKSVNEDGSLSLDKLDSSLRAVATGNFSKDELASLLMQNDVAVKFPAPEIKEKSQASDIAVNSQAPDTTVKSQMPHIAIKPQAQDIAIKSQTPDLEVKSQASNDVINSSTAEIIPAGFEIDSESSINTRTNDIKKAAFDLKKEFMSFVQGSSTGNAGKKVAALHKANAQTQTVQSADNNIVSGSDIKDYGISTVFAAASEPETNQLSKQTLPKGQTRWQKSVEGKIINILDTKNQPKAMIDEKDVAQVKTDTIPAFKDALKQGDQNFKQGINSVVDANPGSETHGAAIIKNIQNAEDINAGTMDFKETSLAGLNSQHMAKVSESVNLKSQTKTVINLPEPLPKVFDKMVVMIKNGEQSGKLIIQPPELGKIDISLTIKDGHIQANLSAENYAVKEIIESNLNQLKQQLTGQGLIVEQFNVSVGSQHRQFADDNGQSWSSGGSGSPKSGLSDAGDAPSTVSNAGINGQYRIDVRV